MLRWTRSLTFCMRRAGRICRVIFKFKGKTYCLVTVHVSLATTDDNRQIVPQGRLNSLPLSPLGCRSLKWGVSLTVAGLKMYIETANAARSHKWSKREALDCVYDAEGIVRENVFFVFFENSKKRDFLRFFEWPVKKTKKNVIILVQHNLTWMCKIFHIRYTYDLIRLMDNPVSYTHLTLPTNREV